MIEINKPILKTYSKLASILMPMVFVSLSLPSSLSFAAKQPVWMSEYWLVSHFGRTHGKLFKSLDALCSFALQKEIESGYTLQCQDGAGQIPYYVPPDGYKIFPTNQCGFTYTCNYGPGITPPQFLGYEDGLLVCEPGYTQLGNTCVGTEEKGCSACPEGNPINPAVGNKYQIERDYAGTGPFSLVFSRAYNSFGSNPGNILYSFDDNPMGGPQNSWGVVFTPDPALPEYYTQYGTTITGKYSNSIIDKAWRHNYDRTIFISTNHFNTIATILRPDSKIVTFKKSGATYISAEGTTTTSLLEVKDASNQVTGWAYTNENDEIENYGVGGNLLSVKNKAGLQQTLYYDTQGRLESIVDPYGNRMILSYDTVGRLNSMTDPAGSVYQYSYSPSGYLASVTYPDGFSRRYVYEDTVYGHALTGIIDENGKRFATWQYNNFGRAISSEHANGIEKVSLDYATNRTIVTDSQGATRTYFTSSSVNGALIGEVREQWSGHIRSKLRTYDINGNIASSIDWNNTLTTYAYDLSRNLETSRIEAATSPQARTISTKWHAKFRTPVQIDEPLRRTTFSHDDNGNVLTRIEQASSDVNGSQAGAATLVGTARKWTYTYNTSGQVLTIDGPLTDVVDISSYSYDTHGNLASITNSAGHLTALAQYDANGRVGSITDPNGLITTLFYNPRGWLISRSVNFDPLIETTIYAYDGVGQLTLVTLPDNSKIHYAYDDAHRLTDISDGHNNSIHYELDNTGNRIHETVKGSAGEISRRVSRIYDAIRRLQQIEVGSPTAH